ncbi:hydrophobic surface binding protein A-domain-containing protein [Aspergillus flavus]|uniref:Hydrophobic surface binding protein A-domain-containing protein n=1 Tax=Aspergillus flavus (strain ATCC 200026 / FGSC A1120 / IAM 13836 / NRRL 3357 / JCM 12722 / SRRC 167) TaxID=332952 RepID=A0A7G5JW80_ASPFN|nr:uncharacterized protein G4B84_003090 [Aspergillus flavus NRRL3357]QMW39872.1 hypothetical protein G4B11_003152 [Aspergillus flavus]KAF7619722.1 hypothetical protein AFLA_001345 [Aspergillus flavus NRRL3357]QMW27801.1 hypothetical protein G4B84_003090 [Aspergillus flavus NRRL3357]QRD82230.1 hydrophobic surface binding protein A-domain-containing protein [Aspergillus flavus]UDD55735.1 hypothetical protein AFCA_003329 [Aspergillus flavus]
MKNLLPVISFAVLTAAQTIELGAPTDGAVLSRGSEFTAQVLKPGSLQPWIEVGIALAVNSCNDGVCPQPSDQLGNVLYAGPWTPTAHPSSGNYQNFTLQVPEYMPEGPATFTLTHLCLIGVSAHNIADISNSLADGTGVLGFNYLRRRALSDSSARAATPILRRDAAKVQGDITQKIEPQINTLYNDVRGFPTSGLTGAMTIRSDLQSLATTVNDATADIKSTSSLDTPSGTTISADIQSLMPTSLVTLTHVGAEAPAWEDIQGGPALILSDLRSLKTALDNFANALISNEPLLLQAKALAIKTQIDGGLDIAIAPYSV